MRWMGVLFSILLLLAYGFIFNTVQANSVAHALRYAFDLPAAVSGGVLAVVVLLAILRGLRGVARLMQWIVPFMALLWIATSLLIGLWHITALPTIFATIFRCAFGWQEAAAGAVGYTISQALTSGFQRGMFSNEAGMGSSPNAAAAAASWPPHPAAQGIVQMIGVFIDTIVICSCTAMIMLLAPSDMLQGLEGMSLLQTAMQYHLGSFGTIFIAATLWLFSFSTFIGILFYARSNVAYLFGDNWVSQTSYKVLALVMLFIGGLAAYTFVWELGDVGIGLMTIFNMAAILKLSGKASNCLKEYENNKKGL